MHPILFEFGPVTVFYLWLFVSIGFAVGSVVFVRLAKRQRMRLTILFDNGFLLFFWTLLISRLFFIVSHWDLYFYQFSAKKISEFFAVWDKGLSFWGAIFAWTAGIIYLYKKEGESYARVFDLMVPSILIGMFFGNIGAFFEGINYGSPTSLPWGMTFLSANVRYILPIHPTQLYSAFYTLLIASLCLLLLQKLRNALPGFIAEAGIFLFGFFKFLEEFLRGDETVKVFSIRVPQLFAFLLMIFAGYLLYRRYFINKHGSSTRDTIQDLFKKLFRRQKKQDPEKISQETIFAPQK